MRTIKFRTPHKDQNGHFRWWYTQIYKAEWKGNWGPKSCKCPTGDITEGFYASGDDQQFTELHDKNGKEIYEGDILKANHQEQQKPHTSYSVQDIVRWHNGGFRVFSCEMSDCTTGEGNRIRDWMWHQSGHLNIPDFYYQISDIEVISNIYENPEMVKGTAN